MQNLNSNFPITQSDQGRNKSSEFMNCFMIICCSRKNDGGTTPKYKHNDRIHLLLFPFQRNVPQKDLAEGDEFCVAEVTQLSLMSSSRLCEHTFGRRRVDGDGIVEILFPC